MGIVEFCILDFQTAHICGLGMRGLANYNSDRYWKAQSITQRASRQGFSFVTLHRIGWLFVSFRIFLRSEYTNTLHANQFYIRWRQDGEGERMGGQSRSMLDVIAHYQTHYSSTYISSHQTMWEEKIELDFLIWVLYINVCITICSMIHNLGVDTTRTSRVWHENEKICS
jgi:hypothetical protein